MNSIHPKRFLALSRAKRPFRTEVDVSEWVAGVFNAVAELQTAVMPGFTCGGLHPIAKDGVIP
jgi:hypothetical protein